MVLPAFLIWVSMELVVKKRTRFWAEVHLAVLTLMLKDAQALLTSLATASMGRWVPVVGLSSLWNQISYRLPRPLGLWGGVRLTGSMKRLMGTLAYRFWGLVIGPLLDEAALV